MASSCDPRCWALSSVVESGWAEEEEIKSKYKLFKKNVEKIGSQREDETNGVVHDRPPHVELRVSGIISNGPYILVLDCDMYCNDPTSAQQAMCFHLDPHMSPSLAFVQYPQIFYNVSKNDIYDGQARSAYKTKWQGMDGLRGPLLSGTGFYLKKKALYGKPNDEDEFLLEPKNCFGLSSKFITSLSSVHSKGDSLDAVLEEARLLASCTYETNTLWGKEASFIY
ncbi:hypothetical protein L1049_016661 [Liquidambar formosana]|uniref:Cellulose synthase n=1 Tax=Liquidambar formosana TaxID=63359 RepID=A0AAP0S6F4_LIQFO